MLFRSIAQGSNWRYLNLRVVGEKFDAKVWDQTKDVANLIELNAAGVEVTDADLAKLGKLTNLRRLNLANATVKDSSLAGLKTLANLEYLNLVGTQVTDAGLKQLAGLKKLQSVYLFESKVTDAKILGFSMVYMQRSLFTSFITKRGGKVQELVAALNR